MKQSLNREEIFANLPVRKAVMKQILPAIASQMVTLIYSLADTYFVGLLNQPNQTAAITIVSAPYILLSALSNLFGVGGAGCVAAALGRKQPEKCKQISSLAVWGGILCSILSSLIFFVMARPILTLCGATEETYAVTLGYAKWVLIYGGPATIMSALLANLIRSEGSASYASLGISFGGLLNMVLDPLFVLPQFLGLGAQGAGAATALSNCVVMLIFLLYFWRKRGMTVLSCAPRQLRQWREHLRPVLSVGLPSALQMILTMISVSALVHFVSQYSTEAVAALGIVKKLDQLPLYAAIGVSNGLLPLLAYNHAAGNHKRRSQCFYFGVTISVSFALLCTVCYEIFAPQLSSLFIADPLTVQYSAKFLRRMVTAMPLMAICYPMIIQFQGMGQVKEALISSVLRKGLLDIPVLFLMDTLAPLYGCMWVQPIVDTISLVVILVFYRRLQKRLRLGDASA